MLEVLICSVLTILPDYLFRRYRQGKRLGHEITFYSVWFELRWGIISCLMLTVGLITVIFYFHPTTTTASSEEHLTGDGVLSLRSRPWARIFADGKDTGRFPPAELTLPAGKHELRLVNDEGKLRTTCTVVVNPGWTLNLSRDLK